MNKRLLEKNEKGYKVKKIKMIQDPKKLKIILGDLTWKILLMLSEKELYPLQIARKLGIHEQLVYYHIKKLSRAGVIIVKKEKKKKGGTAKYFKTVAPAFGIELPQKYELIQDLAFSNMSNKIQSFFKEFVNEQGVFYGKVVVGSPTAHGPFKTSARDGHYAAHLTFFLGQFMKMPKDFAIKLDVDVKVEKEEKNNLILVGGPGTNLLTQEVNKHIPIRFNMQSSSLGFLLGGLLSDKTSNNYTSDTIGLIAKIINPWDKTKRIIVIAGNKAVGTKACVLALTKYHSKTLLNLDNEETFTAVIQGFDLDGDGKVDSIEVKE
ncbi:MAG: helix-turn-helix domain-containing protein [Candidatus Bathyarchaeota archaeon]|jgi:DNA-binding transcriptional ArsR family regulator|nr:helix-turn-helix domain-containing protein [Candidatus Bathyarchaeota archaeon]